MVMTAQSSRHDETLQKTAARLIYILGLDGAIHACRSNCWHGVLRFVLAYKAFVDQQPQPHGSADSERNVERRAVLQTVTQRCQMTPTTTPSDIAA